MLELLYLIFIQPIESGMRFFFENTYALIGSYGLSIIILSLAVSLAVSPLYHLAEKWRNSQRQITEKLAPKVAEINLAFKGRERLMILSALYRQNHYHPIMVVRTSFGLLIQIPFFFAAFHFLGNYEALKGVRFLFFGDLAQPDQALKLAGYGINVMPFVMTALNLSSAFVYGHNLPKNEKLQLYLISGVFLVLLYNSPVALVFYWTLNNCFYLLKNIVYKKYRLLEKTPLTASPGVRKISRQPGLVKKALTNLFEKFGSCAEKHSPPGWVTRCLIFLFVCAFGAHSYFAFTGSFSDTPLTTAVFLVCLAALISIHFIFLGKFAQNFIWNKFHLLFWGVISLVFGQALFVGWNFLLNLSEKRQPVQESEILLILLTALAVSFIGPVLSWIKKFEKNLDLKVYLASGVLIFSLLFIHTPLALLASDISILQNSSAPWFFAQIFLYFSVSLSILYGLHKAIPEENKGAITFFILGFSALGLLYSYAFTGNYGVIGDAWEIQNRNDLRHPLFPTYDLTIIFSTAGLLLAALKYGGRALLFSGLIVANASLAIVTLISAGSMEFGEKIEPPAGEGSLPSYNRDLMSFSKEGKNVIVFMLDMFSGKHMKNLLKKYPELKKDFDGFVWYPYTLSAGDSTLLGEPGIHGGHRFTPIELNRRELVSLEEEIARGFKVFSDSFGQKGFDVSIAGLDITLTRCDTIKKHVQFPLKFCGDELTIKRDYWEYWSGNHKEIGDWRKKNDSPNLAKLLSAIGIFKASPFSFRKAIYSQGEWLGAYKQNVMNSLTAVGRLAFIDSLDSISHADSKKNTFKYIHTKATHVPYALDENCRINSEKRLPKKVRHRKHTACVMKSFVKWFRWLKKNNLYDNSKIIMVSDHGRYRDKPNRKTRADVLMLIKDFYKNGELKTDPTFLSNADTPAIACGAIGGCENIIPDPTKYPIKNRTLFYSAGPWSRISHWKNKFKIDEQYAVKSPPVDLRNWTRLK